MVETNDFTINKEKVHDMFSFGCSGHGHHHDSVASDPVERECEKLQQKIEKKLANEEEQINYVVDTMKSREEYI